MSWRTLKKAVWALGLGVMFPPVGTPLRAAEPRGVDTASKSWKYEVEIVSDGQYRVGVYQAMDSLVCDDSGRLWLRVGLVFPDKQDSASDFYWPRVALRYMVSDDMGLTWRFTDETRPVLPDTRSTLADGTIVETGSHCWPRDRWERYPPSMLPELQRRGYRIIDMSKRGGFYAVIYDMWARRSTDGGKTWMYVPIHKQLPFMATFVEHKYQRLLADGTIVTVAYGGPKADEPRNSYMLRSRDGGLTWDLVTMADGKYAEGVATGFCEPYPVVYPDGRIMTLLRTRLAHPAYIVRSADGGKTWTKPAKTPIISKHPTVTPLSDGTIVCTYPRRYARPYGIRARFTSDMGRTWSDEVVLADNFEISDGLAFPITVELPDGTLYTVMHGKRYLEGERIQAFVFGARWTRSYHQPAAPKMPVPDRLPKFNADRKNRSPWE